MRSAPYLRFALALVAACIVAPLGAQGSYHVVTRHAIGGAGGWDYLAVDTAGHRLFVARSDRITVIDPATGQVLGEISGLHRGHGVAFAYAAGNGFATSGADSTVTMFDLKTLRVLKRTNAAVDDDAVLYDVASNRVFTFNGDAGSATVIDPVTGERIASIPLGGKPEFGVSDAAGHLFVNIEDKGEIVEVDPKAMSVTRRWSIAPCEGPSGLAIDTLHARLFSVCRNKLMAVSDTRAGKLVSTVPIGAGVDAAAYDPGAGNIFASNGEGTLTVIHEDSPDQYRVVTTVPTMAGARTMALDPVTHRVYTASARFGPAPATATPDNPRRWPPVVPGSFTVLVLEP